MSLNQLLAILFSVFVGVYIFTNLNQFKYVYVDTEKNHYECLDSIPPKGSRQKINFGFDDHPVFAIVDFIGPLVKGSQIYRHIVGVSYTFENEQFNDTIYYCKYDELDFHLQDSDFKVMLYPDSMTIKLISKDTSLIVFAVMPFYVENKWIKLPSVKYGLDSIIVSDGLVNVNFGVKVQDTLSVTIMDNSGTNNFYVLTDKSSEELVSELNFYNPMNKCLNLINRETLNMVNLK